MVPYYKSSIDLAIYFIKTGNLLSSGKSIATDFSIFFNTLATTFIFMPRHSKNGGGALSVTPVRASVRAFVRVCVRPLSKFGVRSITFERLHRFNSNLVCSYIISKHRSSLIWVTIH